MMASVASAVRETPSTPVDSPSRPRTIAVVPALNEAGNVGRLVSELERLSPVVDVVVVDDGSTDETELEALEAGARVLRLPFNCGIGASVQVGLKFAIEAGYDVVVRLDGDGQHDPAAIAALSTTMRETGADFVLGSRFIEGGGYQSTLLRRLGARWFALLLRAASGLSITDPTSGLWMANRRAMRVLGWEYSSDYPEVDSLVRLLRNHCRIVECPVEMRPRVAGHSSIGLFAALYYMVKVTIALLIGLAQPRSSHERSP